MASVSEFYGRLTKRQQTAILIAVPAVMAVILAYLAYRSLATLGPDPVVPAMVRRDAGDSLYRQIQSAQNDINAQVVIINRKAASEAKLASLKAEIQLANRRLPREAERSEMRALISDIAKGIPPAIGRVNITSVKIHQAKTGGADRSEDGSPSSHLYQPINYDVEMQGDLNGIIKYIDTVEKNPRFMEVRTIGIQPGKVDLDTVNQRITRSLHRAEITIVTYIYVPTKDDEGQ